VRWDFAKIQSKGADCFFYEIPYQADLELKPVGNTGNRKISHRALARRAGVTVTARASVEGGGGLNPGKEFNFLVLVAAGSGVAHPSKVRVS
jgi:hypothetical protein